MNDEGVVAFLAFDSGGRHGVYIGDDPTADAVIRSGDPLFGSTVVRLDLTGLGINNNGDIAFGYRLADGREGVAVARIVPEPVGTGWLVTAGMVLLRRRKIRAGFRR